MKKLIFSICVILSIASTQVNARDSIVKIKDDNSFYNPLTQLTYLIDVKNKLKISDILDPEYQRAFLPAKDDMPSFGTISSDVWLKFSIQNLLDSSPYLEVDNPTLDTVEYFLFNNQGQLVHHHLSGDFEKIKDRSIQSEEFLLDMNLKGSEVHTCYVKISQEKASTIVTVQIAHLKKFYEAKYSKAIWQGLYFGLILFMLVYNLFLFFSLRENSYLFFALFIACIGLMFALLNGFGVEYFWGDFPIFNQYIPLVGSMAGIFIILFTSSFLNARIKTPKLHIWLLALIGLNLIIIGMNINGMFFISSQLLIYNSTFVLLFIMFVAIRAWSDGFVPAKYFLFSWSFFVTGFIIFLFREYGWMEINKLNGNILQVSSTITILFISFALSKKINIYILCNLNNHSHLPNFRVKITPVAAW